MITLSPLVTHLLLFGLVAAVMALGLWLGIKAERKELEYPVTYLPEEDRP